MRTTWRTSDLKATTTPNTGTHRGDPHTLIEGDALHVATDLHRAGEKFDVIYLDPPYDTGSPLTYADSLGEEAWTKFFTPRFTAATSVLAKPHGVVIIAIDDRRLGQLRMIADAALCADAFVACIVWDGGSKGQARLISTSHDYMLIYVADPRWYREERIRWRERKPGVDEVLATAQQVWDGNPQ